MPPKKFNTLKLSLYSFLLAILGTSTAYGQFNVKIGYNLNYSPFDAHNTIFEDFSTDRPWLLQGFKDLHFFNALQLGARFRTEYLGIDATWERSSANRSAQGIMSSGERFGQDLEYVTQRIGSGVEVYRGSFGLGANVFYEIFSISSPVAEIESDMRIMRSSRFGNKVYLILSSTGTDRLSISLQPYLAIPWSHHNLSPLSKALGVRSDRGFIQENLHFGFSLVFYNGAQNF